MSSRGWTNNQDNVVALAKTLRSLGYQVVDGMEEAALLVTRSVTPEIMLGVQRGTNALLIAGAEMLAQANAINLPFAQLMPREGTMWQGDWATSFSWLRKEGPFAHLPGGPLLETEYANIMPDVVITNVLGWSTQHAVWAGLAAPRGFAAVYLSIRQRAGDLQI